MSFRASCGVVAAMSRSMRRLSSGSLGRPSDVAEEDAEGAAAFEVTL